jgi:hypothetical protein
LILRDILQISKTNQLDTEAVNLVADFLIGHCRQFPAPVEGCVAPRKVFPQEGAIIPRMYHQFSCPLGQSVKEPAYPIGLDTARHVKTSKGLGDLNAAPFKFCSEPLAEELHGITKETPVFNPRCEDNLGGYSEGANFIFFCQSDNDLPDSRHQVHVLGSVGEGYCGKFLEEGSGLEFEFRLQFLEVETECCQAQEEGFPVAVEANWFSKVADGIGKGAGFPHEAMPFDKAPVQTSFQSRVGFCDSNPGLGFRRVDEQAGTGNDPVGMGFQDPVVDLCCQPEVIRCYDQILGHIIEVTVYLPLSWASQEK